MNEAIFRIPVGRIIDDALTLFVDTMEPMTLAFSSVVETWIQHMENFLIWLPVPLTIFFFAACAFASTRQTKFTFFTAVGFGLVYSMNLWDASMSTLALVVVSTLLAVAIGMPLGILAGINNLMERCIIPVLDVMQTMPSFVYLIPIFPLFGLGKVAAVFATLIFALPPTIRMTSLGIRQAPPELVECAEAFGSTRLQRLVMLEMPLAVPTILAGINQTVMLALSMVVVAAMIGAQGLGGEVWKAINRLEVDMAFEAGIGIVIIAIFLDRMLQRLGLRSSHRRQ